MITGPVALLKEPIYYYNMGCYEALLGNVHDAEANLQISFRMDSSFRDLAKKDPDLKALHAVFEGRFRSRPFPALAVYARRSSSPLFSK